MSALTSFTDLARAPGECILRIDGVEISELYPFLTQVTAETGRQPASTARLTFETVRGSDGAWSIQDKGVLVPWKSIVISAAFGDSVEEVFRGVIRQVRADYPREPGAATVTVECQDDSIRLDRSHRRKTWGKDSPLTDQAILRQLLSPYPLVLHPKSGLGVSGLVLNQDSTDIAFLLARAEANGYELIFDAGQVYFGPFSVSDKPQPTILVYAGPATNCLRFNVTSDGHQPETVSFDTAPATGTTPITRTVASNLPLLGKTPATSDPALGPFDWRLTRQGATDPTLLAAMAQRRANEAAMRIRAEGELDGTLYGHVLKPGHPVGVDGAGEWLDGIYYVDCVSHRFDTAGYVQAFKLMRNAYGNNLSVAGANSLGGLFS